MKYAIQNNKGFEVTEVIRLKSKNGTLSLNGEIKGDWSDSSLTKIPADVVMRYLTLLGQTLVKDYKSKLSSWQKTVQKSLDKAEKTIEKKTLAFEKAGKKTPPTGKQVENFVSGVNTDQMGAVATIGREAEASYSKMVGDMMKSVLAKTAKAMADKASLFKKSNASFAFKVLKFVGAAVLLTAAAIAVAATGGTAAAVGFAAAALVFKGLSLLKGIGTDVVNYCKTYEAAMIKVDRGVTSASATIDTAIADMRSAQKARDGLIVQLGQALGKMEEAQRNAAGNADNKELKKAMSNLKKMQDSIAGFDKSIGGNPTNILPGLEAARKSLKDAANSIPVQVKSGKSSGMIGKMFDKVNDVVTQVGSWVN